MSTDLQLSIILSIGLAIPTYKLRVTVRAKVRVSRDKG